MSSNFETIISNFKNKNILVIGDVILDQHIMGSVSRISPEAPVPVVLQKGQPTFAPGGAANVANNLQMLGAKVQILSRIGHDPEGKRFIDELKKRKIAQNNILLDRSMPTIVKTRIMAQHQQVIRLDREKICPIEDALLQKILSLLKKQIKNLDAIIISDYGKGMITERLLKEICGIAKRNKKILTVDPKVEHFQFYRGVTAITPNKKETENAIRNIKITDNGRKKLDLNSDRLETYEDVEKSGKQLLKYLDLESLMITLGEQGVCLLEKGKKAVHIHTKAQDVFDVTGAGDTVIAVMTLSLSAGASKLQAADLANYAAGIVVGKMGPATVSAEELLKATQKI